MILVANLVLEKRSGTPSNKFAVKLPIKNAKNALKLANGTPFKNFAALLIIFLAIIVLERVNGTKFQTNAVMLLISLARAVKLPKSGILQPIFVVRKTIKSVFNAQPMKYGMQLKESAAILLILNV